MDTDWALGELRTFVDLSTLETPTPVPGIFDMRDTRFPRGRQAIPAAAQVVEQILDRVVPDWRTVIGEDKSNRWQQHREAAQRAIAQLERDAELQERLGDAAPSLNASQFHPWIWEGAHSLWQSHHYREAVRAASVKLNAETQNKLGIRDLSETALFQLAFSSDSSNPSKPRLRLPDDDGGKSSLSIRRGMMAFAEGCYAAIRNPSSHDLLAELPENDAMEQLACFSVLARWVDRGVVIK